MTAGEGRCKAQVLRYLLEYREYANFKCSATVELVDEI